MIRVLQVVEATGGVARHVVDLCLGLAQREVEVHLAYSPLRMDGVLQKGLPVLKEAGVQLLEIPIKRSPHPSDLKVLIALKTYLNQNGPFDLIHGHSSKGGALARVLRLLGGKKALYTPNAFVTLAPSIKPLERWIYGAAERFLSLFTSVLIAVSQDEAQEGRRLGFPLNKIKLIPNSIDLSAHPTQSRESMRKELGAMEEQIVVGYVGRFVLQKAPLMLVEAFAQVASKFSQARLVMVGDGPLREEIERRLHELGLEDRVTLPGFMEGRSSMRAFDLFALSSAYEGFPYVLLEAMAEGLPIITTRVGGTELALANSENGFVVEVGDVKGFSQGLARLLEDQELRKHFGQQSLKQVQRFDLKMMVEETLSLYREVVGTKSRYGQEQ